MTPRLSITQSGVKWAGLAAGPVLALVTYLLLPETFRDTEGNLVAFTHAGRATAATAIWMATWWLTEAVPVYVTALLPLAILPVTGAVPIRETAAPYAHELIFLFMGGFLIALSMQRWNLHRRFAYSVLRVVGSNPFRLVGGFMLITALLSMWVSNTATTIMMLPIALSVIGTLGRPEGGDVPGQSDGAPDGAPGGARERGSDNLTLALLLGIAYAASIGGIGTLIGTPPNLFLASFVRSNLGGEIGFVRWMGVGLPLVAVFLPLTWLLLTRVIFPIRDAPVRDGTRALTELGRTLGPMGRGERATFLVFACTALAWIFRPLLVEIEIGGATPLANLSDPGIAIIAGIALFLIPVNVRRRQFVMDWRTAAGLPWGLLLLFGGGLSLAAAIRANGVGEFIAHQVSGLAGVPSIVVVLFVVTIVIFLTELTSNTATTATLVPILAALAPGMGFRPLLLIVPAAIAASCAFMLPVATPPNAIVFGSGHVTVPQMSRAGLWLNVAGIVLITGLTYAVAMPLLAGG